MVLTITVVGNGQGTNNAGHAVVSPNELAQLMSGQTVTGLLNPDGSITLNSNVMSTPQLTSMSTTIPNGTPPMISQAGTNYQTRLQVDQVSAPPTNSITNIQTIASESTTAINNQHSQNSSSTHNPTQKKTGQKRLTAKQKLAQQQQKAQPIQSPDNRSMMPPSDQPVNQQPQIVATIQLPNGQIGQLIAPSGGQFWSPNAINLQQLSMAVAAATGTMPQPMSIPEDGSTQSGQQIGSPTMQQQQTQQSIQAPSQQQQPSQSLNNTNQQHQVMTTVQLPNNQIGQVMGRQGQSQIWSGGPISLTQLSALAQQGVVQLSPVQGIPTTGPNGQRVMEMIPQATIQGLLSQNGQPVQAISLSSGGQFITQDPNDPGKWQIVQPSPISNQPPNIQASANNSGESDNSTVISRGTGNNTFNQPVNSSQNTVLNDNTQTSQPQRKLKRLACTCPNCRDGDNNRNNGDKKKQHICHFPDCNKVYGKTSHLRAHLRWHSGERPYVCNWSFCGKKFTRSDELQRHRRTHTGEKRFQCMECLKRFMRSDHLSKHLKTHLSSKKSSSSQQQTNGIPSILTLPESSNKLDEDMIEDIHVVLDSMEKSKHQTDYSTMNSRLNVDNSI